MALSSGESEQMLRALRGRPLKAQEAGVPGNTSKLAWGNSSVTRALQTQQSATTFVDTDKLAAPEQWDADKDARIDARNEAFAASAYTLVLVAANFGESGTEWSDQQINTVIESTKSILMAASAAGGIGTMVGASLIVGIWDVFNPYDTEVSLEDRLAQFKQDLSAACSSRV